MLGMFADEDFISNVFQNYYDVVSIFLRLWFLDKLNWNLMLDTEQIYMGGSKFLMPFAHKQLTQS